MIEIENVEVFNIEGAIRAMRNPKKSWAKSDSAWVMNADGWSEYRIGKNDLGLMQRLYQSGVPHRTFARMIMVSMDITAPLYWWKEMDRYTVGKTQISTSTMHTLHKRDLTIEDFSVEYLDKPALIVTEGYIDIINAKRLAYVGKGNENLKADKQTWYSIIQMLPESYNQKRTVLMSYEVIFKILHERSSHKLQEWIDCCEALRNLPYIKEIMEGGSE